VEWESGEGVRKSTGKRSRGRPVKGYIRAVLGG